MGGFGIDRYIIVFSRFSIYIRVRGENNDESCPTQGRRYLHSICLQIHTDYLTFLFEKKKKRLLRNECKEHSFVCKRDNHYQQKLFWLFIDVIDCLAMV